MWHVLRVNWCWIVPPSGLTFRRWHVGQTADLRCPRHSKGLLGQISSCLSVELTSDICTEMHDIPEEFKLLMARTLKALEIWIAPIIWSSLSSRVHHLIPVDQLHALWRTFVTLYKVFLTNVFFAFNSWTLLRVHYFLKTTFQSQSVTTQPRSGFRSPLSKDVNRTLTCATYSPYFFTHCVFTLTGGPNCMWSFYHIGVGRGVMCVVSSAPGPAALWHVTGVRGQTGH